MKLQVVSDLHLEFGSISIENAGDTDVLILSGDICLASELRVKSDPDILGMAHKTNQYHLFFQECCERFKHVFYVAGNHEHYHGDIAKSYNHLKEMLSYLPNLYIMEKEVKEIDDVVFIAGTLWTNMNKEDPITIGRIRGYMNDYRIIEDTSEMVNYKVYEPKDKPVGMTDEEWLALPYESRVVDKFKTRPGKFTPEKSIMIHKEMIDMIKKTISTLSLNKKVVVIGHHAPSKQSTKPFYQGDFIVNGAYSSDLSELILDNPCIKLWTHGHTHDTFDYMIGSTRIVCNPRGYYNYEENISFDAKKVIEI